MIVAIFNLFDVSRQRSETLPYSSLAAALNGDLIVDAQLAGTTPSGHLRDGRPFVTFVPSTYDMLTPLVSKGVRVSVASGEPIPSAGSIAISWFPMLVYLAAVWVFFARPVRGAALAVERLETTLRQRL